MSFTGCYIDLEGDALSSFGSRTAPDWEGKGIKGNIKSYMYDYVKRRYPSVKIESSDTWVGTLLLPLWPKMMVMGFREETRNVERLA